MADIVIRGMEMPPNCLECVLTHSFFRNLRCDKLEGMSGYVGPMPHTNDRHPDCPIVPLPEGHGRLIDADALKRRAEKGTDEHGKLCMLIKYGYVNTMPTIIEAEGGGKDG